MNLVLCSLCLLSAPVAAYDPLPRWGQATVVIIDALYVHGGKTDQYNSYSYTSAPTNADLLFLPLSSPFDVSSPPWQLLNGSSSQGPAVVWHTLSAFNTSGALLFGGQPGPNSPTVLADQPDSASLLNVYNKLTPTWVPEVTSWAGQPIRRMHHTTATVPSGHIFIIGGEKADGSDIAYLDHYLFDPAGPSFTLLPADNGPPGICGHASIILPDGRLFVFGGYSQPQATLLPFSTIFTMDTTQSNLSWTTLTISNSSLPSPRRAFAATLLSDGNILIHGGSDAAIQNNLDDGWILDTSQNPMVWTQISVLSELGARRDHFAVSSGSQVIFGFGYGSNGAAPAALQIFDVAKGSFTSTLSASPSSSSTLTQTIPGPSQTSNRGTGMQGGYPTTTTDPGSSGGSGGGGNGGSKHGKNTIAITIGVVFGFLSMVVVGVVVYHVRRRQQRTRGQRRFVALNGDDDDEGTHPTEGIPAARFSDDPYNRHRWGFGLLDSIGLASILSAATGGGTVRHIPQRRDMLADEDAEFGEWYDARRRDGSGESAWSLRSILGARIRSREPSATSILGEGAVRREKSDPFSDKAALVRDTDIGYTVSAVTAAGKSQGRRQMSYSSTKDYAQVEALADVEDEDVPSTSIKYPSQNTLVAMQGHTMNSTSSLAPSLAPNSSLPSSSNQTSLASLEAPRSPVTSPSSMIGSSTTPTSQTIRRSDSWWTRFSRTGFLDRRVSDASRHSGMLDIRDPNPRPQLIPIEESTHSTFPDHEVQHSPPLSDSVNRRHSLSRKPSGAYGAHNKSLSSLRTADSEAIEKMAGAVDVVQRFRTASTNRSRSTTSSADSMTEVRSDLLGEDKDIDSARHEDATPFVSLHVDMPESFGRSFQHSELQSSIVTKGLPSSSYPSPPSPGSSATSLMVSSPRVGAGAVASRIREYEGRMSLDQEVPSPTNKRHLEERLKRKGPTVAVNYGLVQRPSLFIANPDGRATPSGD